MWALSCCQRTLLFDWQNFSQLGICLLSFQCPLLPIYFMGFEHHVVQDITATLQSDWSFLSCCDLINLDGSETMNDDITIWALATRHFKNQLAFGQNKRLHRKSNVVWRENFWINGLLHGHCSEDCIGSWVTLSYNRKYSDLHCNLHMYCSMSAVSYRDIIFLYKSNKFYIYNHNFSLLDYFKELVLLIIFSFTVIIMIVCFVAKENKLSTTIHILLWTCYAAVAHLHKQQTWTNISIYWICVFSSIVE